MHNGFLISLVAFAGSACSQPRTSPVPTPSAPSARAALGCELAGARHGDRLALAFVLSNHSASPRTIHYAQPFMLFDLRVMSDGADLRIVRGDFDGPAMPTQLVIPAHGTARLETPVTLQFAAEAPPSGDAFAWTVIGTPHSVELRATLRIEHEAVMECVAHIDVR